MHLCLLPKTFSCTEWNRKSSTQSWWRSSAGRGLVVRWLRWESSLLMIRTVSLWEMSRDLLGRGMSLPCSSLKERPADCVDYSFHFCPCYIFWKCNTNYFLCLSFRICNSSGIYQESLFMWAWIAILFLNWHLRLVFNFVMVVLQHAYVLLRFYT